MNAGDTVIAIDSILELVKNQTYTIQDIAGAAILIENHWYSKNRVKEIQNGSTAIQQNSNIQEDVTSSHCSNSAV